MDYIRQNPIDARLVIDVALYEFIGFPQGKFPQGLKPGDLDAINVRAEARTLQPKPYSSTVKGLR